MREANEHVSFVMDLCLLQRQSNSYFLYEHPEKMTSSHVKQVRRIQNLRGVEVTKVDQGIYGFMARGLGGEPVAACKLTKFVTNAPEVASEFKLSCDQSHGRQELRGGLRYERAGIYPRGLCEAICRGFRRQVQFDQDHIKLLMTLNPDDAIVVDGKLLHVAGTARAATEKRQAGVGHEEDSFGGGGGGLWAYDDVSGVGLDPAMVQQARLKEVQYLREKEVYRKIPRQQAVRMGIPILRSRWVDIDKGDAATPNYRSRFVAMEFNNQAMDGLFASTPPLEALKLLVSCAATSLKEESAEMKWEKDFEQMIMVSDIARAFFEAPATRNIAVELPPEDLDESEVDCVGLLLKSLYGTRDAAKNFQEEVKRFLIGLGLNIGKYNTSTFFHAKRNLKLLVHGDDFVSTGTRKGLY